MPNFSFTQNHLLDDKILKQNYVAPVTKLQFPLVAALCKSFLSLAWHRSVLEMSSYILVCLFCPSNSLMLPLFFPKLALESAQNPLDVLALTFFPQKVFGRTLEGLQ